MGPLTRLSIALIATSFAGTAAVAQTAAPTASLPPTPRAMPSPNSPPKLGPVLADGKSTYILTFDKGNSKTVLVSQANAPSNLYFVATVGTICIGAVNVTGSGPSIPNGAITSNGPFTFTRVGNTTGCAVSITSSAGGLPATVVFQ